MINETTTTLHNDKTLFTLPKFLSQLQHITTVDTGGLQFIICCDKLKLYIFPLIQGGNKPLGSVHQSLPIPNIKSIRTIAKNFLMIQTENKYLGIFQIIKSATKQPASDKPVSTLQANTVKVQFSEVLKWRAFSSYFLREVMENLFEVQVFFTDLDFEIFHFTNKNKKGSMSFTISQNGRILKSSKKQLYGSKFFFNIGRKLIYWMKNFSDKQFILQQIVAQQPMGSMKLEPFGYFGVQRAEQYKILSPNLVIRDCLNPAKRHSLQIEADSFLNDLKAQLSTLSPTSKKKSTKQQQNPFNQLVQRDGISQILESYKFTIFTDLLMIQNKQKKKMQIYQIRTEGSSIVGKQESYVHLQKEDSSMLDLRRWQWYFGNSKKLIGIDRIGFKLKYVQQMSLRDKSEQIKQNSQMTIVSEIKNQKVQQNKQQPAKDTTKNGTQKEIAPQKTLISQNQKQQQDLSERKFSKDEIKKYCEDFDQKKQLQLVDENLIKKVEQIKKSLQKLPQKTKENTIQANQTKEKEKSQQDYSKKINEILLQKQEKAKNSKTQMNNKNQIQKQTNQGTNQQQIVLKQKPPVKIIQKNKVSVAKSFISQQEAQTKQSTNITKEQKQDKKENNSLPKEEPKIQKVVQQQVKKEENNFPKQQKKRFMQNYLSQQKKQSQKQQAKQQNQNLTNQVQVKIKQTKNKEVIEPKEQKEEQKKQEKKQEKKKFNVITRATLIKKKQNQASKEPQSTVLPEKQQNKVPDQSKAVTVQNKIHQTKQQKIESPQDKNEQELNLPNQQQEKPKTRYIPSIDKKASAGQLNECQFLSQDSQSQDQDDQTEKQKQKAKTNTPLHEDEQIEEQIEGQSGYSSGQEDMEHLIDDDLGKDYGKKTTNQEKRQLSPEEDIQKFCNTLLQEKQTLVYQKTVAITSSSTAIQKQKSPNKNITVKTDKIITTVTEKTQISNSQQLNTSELDKNATKQQTNEINQLNSLLFKTNIKRNNIFGSDEKSEEQIKTQQNKNVIKKISNEIKIKENDDIKVSKQLQKHINQENRILQNSQKQVHKSQEVRNSQNDKKLVQQKKPKVWHDLSSDSDDQRSLSEDEQLVKTQHNQLKSQKSQQKGLSNQQLNITQALQKLKKVESQCTKILSDIQEHKAKEIKSKLLQQKPVEQSQVEKKAEKISESNEVQDKIQTQQNKQKVQPNIFTLPLPSLSISNPFLTPSQPPQNSLFPTNTTPSWLSNRPPAHMIQKKDHNPFINFKKSLQQTQSNHHNLFGLGENVNAGSSNTFRKFLNERQNKTQQIKDTQSKPIEQNNILQTKEPQKVNVSKQANTKMNQPQTKTPQQSQLIPTTLLPKIQQLIISYEQSTLNLLQKQQSMILKSLQDIPNTHNPYNKNHSLLLPQQIKEEIIKQSKNTVKKWLATKMLDKIQSSFRQIMQEHKKVYEDALKYYEGEAKRRITTMQLQYQQQQSILTDIQNVAANLSSALQGSVLEGEQMHTFQLKQWKNQITQAQTVLIQPLNQRLQDSKQFYNQRNKNLQNLGNELSEIKQILKNKLKKKQQMKELKQKKKLKLQFKLKQEETKKPKKIQQEPKKPKTQKLRNQTETSFPHYYNPPQYGQYDTQYYPRPPYPYY